MDNGNSVQFEVCVCGVGRDGVWWRHVVCIVLIDGVQASIICYLHLCCSSSVNLKNKSLRVTVWQFDSSQLQKTIQLEYSKQLTPPIPLAFEKQAVSWPHLLAKSSQIIYSFTLRHLHNKPSWFSQRAKLPGSWLVHGLLVTDKAFGQSLASMSCGGLAEAKEILAGSFFISVKRLWRSSHGDLCDEGSFTHL